MLKKKFVVVSAVFGVYFVLSFGFICFLKKNQKVAPVIPGAETSEEETKMKSLVLAADIELFSDISVTQYVTKDVSDESSSSYDSSESDEEEASFLDPESTGAETDP